jgi:tetratricopeptide (TPR) repeat protein
MVTSAREEARKALELFPSEPTSHAVLGAIAASYDYDWTEAAEQFRLAMASESLTSGVYDLYAVSYLSPLGRFQEAIEQQAKAIAQDPLNVFWRVRQCIPLLFAEMYDRAITEAQRVLEFENKSLLAHFVIAQAHFFEGRVAEARAPAEEAFRRAPWSASARGFLAGLLAQMGEQERAAKLIDTMRGASLPGRIYYHFMRSEVDTALDCYERGIEQRQRFATEWICAGFLKPLRSSPRWPKLARMMNLPVTGESLQSGGIPVLMQTPSWFDQ